MHGPRVFAEKVKKRPFAAELGRREDAAASSCQLGGGGDGFSKRVEGGKPLRWGKKCHIRMLKVLEIVRADIELSCYGNYIEQVYRAIGYNRTRNTSSSVRLKISTVRFSSRIALVGRVTMRETLRS